MVVGVVGEAVMIGTHCLPPMLHLMGDVVGAGNTVGVGDGKVYCFCKLSQLSYCFANQLLFKPDPLGPTFSLRKPESTTAYTYLNQALAGLSRLVS